MTGTNAGSRLDSWKAIAAYLGRDTGTVRRWERTRGLPVHRVPGGKGSSVFAYTDEIDAWLKSAASASAGDDNDEPDAEVRAGWRWGWAALPLAIAFVVFAGWRMQRAQGVSAAMRVELSELAVTAKTESGEPLWAHELGAEYRHLKTEVSDALRVVPGHNPRVYYLISHRERRTDLTADGGEFGALDGRGRPIFIFRFDDMLTFGGKPYGAPWALTAFSVLDGEEPQRFAVAAHHWLWGPSLLAVLDGAGKRLGTFANEGWIEQLHWLSPERLVFGGFSHAWNGGMVGLLDPRELDGQAPAAPDSRYHCSNCGANPPLAMAVMPRTELNTVTQSRFNRAVVQKTPNRLIVRTIEMPPVPDNQGAVDVIYEFTHGLELTSATYSERYWEMHDRLAAERKLDHDRESCPNPEPPPIHMWRPGAGWRRLPG